jgi:ABC-type Fe3+/spermidine/putrescine transport system ATPase subunit
MIAGLEHPDSGSIHIGDQDVTNLPPWDRGLGMVFQQYANFPHMSVAQNVAYGLRRQRPRKEEVRSRVSELLAMVGLSGFEERRVTQLSGGEQQRVAIARALAPRPRLLLLDEPLSALDEKIRREMQTQLRDINRATRTTFIYVTHDQEEALTMSDRVAVLNNGHIVRRPRTRFVARFFRGCNVIDGEISVESGQPSFRCNTFKIPISSVPEHPSRPHAIAIRAEDIHLGVQPGKDEISFPAVVERATYRGVYTDYVIAMPGGEKLIASASSSKAESGAKTTVCIRKDAIVPLEAEPD